MGRIKPHCLVCKINHICIIYPRAQRGGLRSGLTYTTHVGLSSASLGIHTESYPKSSGIRSEKPSALGVNLLEVHYCQSSPLVPPLNLWFQVECPNFHWMDFHKNIYTHSRSLEDESWLPWWSGCCTCPGRCLHIYKMDWPKFCYRYSVPIRNLLNSSEVFSCPNLWLTFVLNQLLDGLACSWGRISRSSSQNFN